MERDLLHRSCRQIGWPWGQVGGLMRTRTRVRVGSVRRVWHLNKSTCNWIRQRNDRILPLHSHLRKVKKPFLTHSLAVFFSLYRVWKNAREPVEKSFLLSQNTNRAITFNDAAGESKYMYFYRPSKRIHTERTQARDLELMSLPPYPLRHPIVDVPGGADT